VVVQNIRTTSTPPYLTIRSGSVIALVNEGDCSVKVPLHALVAGFGRGKFREIKLDGGEEGALNPEKEIAFHLEDSSDLVLLENKATTLSEAVTARNDSTGQAAIAYHTMVNKP
ncbi:Uncharacterized protein SCF082_LOCUS40832, partial [Durusdinium trenchii]